MCKVEEKMNLLSVGSVVIIDAGQAFIVMKKDNGYTIAEVLESGIEAKDVFFPTLEEMEQWFNECESKICKVIPFESHLIKLHRLAEEVRPFHDRTIESLGFSVRTYNALKRVGINFESQIKEKSYNEITKIRNFSRKSLVEIEQTLNIKFV
jgi:DNA-directed RNA polymerase alpha subunit